MSEVKFTKTKARLTGLKTCIICHERLEIAAFSKYAYTTNQGKRSERFSSRCKECESERRMVRHSENRDEDVKRAREWKQRTNYSSTKARAKYSEEAKERLKIQRRASEAKRRIVCGENPRLSETYIRVLGEAKIGNKWLDAYSFELIDDPTIDHIVAVSKGGLHDYWNLCVTSRKNNSSKHTHGMLSWLLTQ